MGGDEGKGERGLTCCAAPVLQEAGVYKEVKAEEQVSLGCKRVVVPMKGWWTDVEREETLVSLNPSKRWLSVSVTG